MLEHMSPNQQLVIFTSRKKKDNSSVATITKKRSKCIINENKDYADLNVKRKSHGIEPTKPAKRMHIQHAESLSFLQFSNTHDMSPVIFQLNQHLQLFMA